MKLQDFLGTELKFGMEAIAADVELARQIQIRLIALGLLDPPADGKFWSISTQSLKEFQKLTDCGEPDYLGKVTAEKLIETKELPTLALTLSNDLASRIIKYMQYKNYTVTTNPKEYNIIYIEGMNADGSLNNDAPNVFNDRRMVIEFNNGKPRILGNWEATTEPGNYYTLNPMNPAGAARIRFGQYKAWRVDIHGNAEPHEALVQAAPVSVHRDFNKDYVRIGDAVDTGLFGINQHYGYDYAVNDVYKASAGCLVGRTRSGHRDFMNIIKGDRRYQQNKAYLFVTTVIPGDELVKLFPAN